MKEGITKVVCGFDSWLGSGIFHVGLGLGLCLKGLGFKSRVRVSTVRARVRLVGMYGLCWDWG